MTPEQETWHTQWKWSRQRTGRLADGERDAIIAYCHAFGKLPLMHKNVRRSYQQTAEKNGWFKPLPVAVGE